MQMLGRMRARLREAIRRKGMNYTDLGAWLGVTKQSVAAWLRGESYPSPVNMLRLCEVLDIDPGELWSGLKPEPALGVHLNKRLATRAKLVPLYTTEVAAGEMAVKHLEPVQEEDALAAPIEMSTEGFAFRVTTDVNAPEIKEGDIVFIDPEVAVRPGRWVFVAHSGAFLLRRYLPKALSTHVGATLKAANPVWPDEVLNDESLLIGSVIARVETFQS